ncbi:MAG: hypothetical protein QHH43_09680, partial [Candidatus Saccharicenans sp.]|nr:hypothetical protein [Candidatus Saccharicenans sp.]
MKKSLIINLCLFIFAGLVFGLLAQESQVQKARVFAEEYPLLTDTDLYCSVLVWDKALPEIQIIGSEREDERAMMVDSDTFYINKGKEDGMEIGQMFL